MTFRTIVRGAIRRSLAFITGFALVCSGAPGLFAQDSTAAIAGVIFDPAGKPASGFKVTVRDVASNLQFTSGPTDAAGNYTVDVPIGGRYKIDNVVAADGVTKLAVQDVAPVSVLAAGTTRLNVHFANTPAPATQTAATTPASDDKKKKKHGEVPWYKKPGPIVGLVLGSVAVAALALSAGGGDDNNNEASPYTPPAP
jgi:hypothetical protein